MKVKIKRIICFLLFCSLLVGTGKLLRYLLVDDTSSYTRVTFHEMYEQDNIDILFVGSSHCYRSFIPELLDEKLGCNTFNGGTSAQTLDGSYMIIKEAAKYNDIDHIYLELYYNISDSIYKERTELTQTYIIADYLRPSLDKICYLLNASSKKYYSNSFILARRNWTRFFDADAVRELLIRKNTDAYKNYKYDYITRDNEWYCGKGYVANNEVIEDGDYFAEHEPAASSIVDVSQDWIDSLEDIIAFCGKKNISLTLVAAPMSNYQLVRQGDYDEYIETVKNVIAGTNIRYYDFNLCKETYIPNTSTLFKDGSHLNCYGAELFSNLFADFVNGNISEDELFWNSYAEKLSHLEPTVFGVNYYDSQDDNGEVTRHCEIISTPNDDLEYEILLSPSEGESCKVQEYSANKLFTVAPDDHGTITITYRLHDLPNETRTCNISY